MADEERLARLCDQAEGALEEGDPEEALDVLDDALVLSPRFAPALLLKTEALFALDLAEDALDTARRCARLCPDDPRVMVRLADLLVFAQGHDPEVVQTALGHLARAEKLAAGTSDALFWSDLLRSRGQALAASGDLDAATESLERARDLAGDAADDDLLVELASAWFEQLRFPEAKELLARVAARAPEHPDALHYLGLLAEREGDDERAHELFELARLLDPDTYPEPVHLDEDEFEKVIADALEDLPERVRGYLRTTPIVVEPLPRLDDLVGPPALSPLCLGLVRGPVEKGDAATERLGQVPSDIHLFQKNLERYAATREELVEDIQVTLFHEVGPFLGWDEAHFSEHGLH